METYPICATRVRVVWLAAILVVATAAQPAYAEITAEQAEQAALHLLGEAPAPGSFCGTPHAVVVAEALAAADPLRGGLLARALQRPALAHQIVSPSGEFRLHFDTTGRNAVDPTDRDDNGIPDYVDLAAGVADSAWRVQIDQLGYLPPPSDEGLGGGDEIDIYILDTGSGGNYGITFPTSGVLSGPSHMHIDNDFMNPIFGSATACPGYVGKRGSDALRVTLTHELFHVVQFGYYQGSDGSWWQEATATWMEDVVYPEQDDYLQYLCTFLQAPERSLDSGLPQVDYHAYGASVFAHFLDQRYGRDVVHWIWEELGRRRSAHLDHFDRILRSYNTSISGVEDPADGGIEAAFSEMSVWSWFVGPRHREGFFDEGDKYPAYYEPPFAVSPKAAASDDGHLGHMATRFVRFEPQLLPGGAILDTRLSRGRWRRHVVLVTADSIEVRNAGRTGEIRLAGWDAYEEVVLVLSNVDVIGFDYDYEVLVEYDPELTDAPAPLAMSLQPGAPNPFRPADHEHTRIAFELGEPTSTTRLSLFSASGQAVRVFDLGPRSARRHSVLWDGTNQTGAPVGSGVYYAVLEADGTARRRAIAVIRAE